MPVSADYSLPEGSSAAIPSTSVPSLAVTTEDLLQKFKHLNADATKEEGQEEDEEDEGGSDGGARGPAEAEDMNSTGVELGSNSKKKKRKGKASKAVAKLK